MTSEMSRGNARKRAHHGKFGPAIGSFEFTGENANATDRRASVNPVLSKAAQAFLRRVGS
jgi:hypothetical protein